MACQFGGDQLAMFPVHHDTPLEVLLASLRRDTVVFCACFSSITRHINKVTRHKMRNVLLLLITIVGSTTGELVISCRSTYAYYIDNGTNLDPIPKHLEKIARTMSSAKEC